MKILILDDDDIRHNSFKSHLLVNHFLTHSRTIHHFKNEVQTNKYDIVFLDHDLNFECYESKDQNGIELTGYDAAMFLVKELPEDKRPNIVIVHSHNRSGARRMLSILMSGKYQTYIWEFDKSKHPLNDLGITQFGSIV